MIFNVYFTVFWQCWEYYINAFIFSLCDFPSSYIWLSILSLPVYQQPNSFWPAFLYVFSFNSTFSYPLPLMSHPFLTPPCFLTSSHASLIQLGEETCTTSLPSCQRRTSIVPWTEGKTKIILFAEIHSRNISSGKGSYPQVTGKKETMWRQWL